MSVDKWPRQARKQKPKGRAVSFQDGVVVFYATIFRSPKTGKERPLVFRVHQHRDYMDRFHWWYVQERHLTVMPSSYDIVKVEPPSDEWIKKWMDCHIWTFIQKGFPTAMKYRKRITQDAYNDQLAWLKKQKDRGQKYRMEFPSRRVFLAK